MTRYEFKQPAWLLMIVLLLGFTANTLNAEDYNKRVLRGLYIGHAEDTLNYLELSLNFLFGEDPGTEESDVWQFYKDHDFCSQENALTWPMWDYSAEGLNPQSSLQAWKTLIDNKSLPNPPNRMAHWLGEENPVFYDPIWYDAMNYVIPTKIPSNELVDHLYGYGAMRPDCFIWVKGVDLVWVYPYPFRYKYLPPDQYPPGQYEEYQDSLQKYCVDYYNEANERIRNARMWGSCPALRLGTCLQGSFDSDANGNPNPDGTYREPTHEEMLCEGWVALSRGAKAFAYYYYQDNPSESHRVALTNEDGTKNDMYYWAKDFFAQVKAIDDNLKDAPFSYANGLYEVELAKYKSIRGDMLGPEFFVREIIVYPPSGKTKMDVYTELSLHYSPYGHNFFLLLNRSLHLSEPVEYDITLLWQGEGDPVVIDLTSGESITPITPLQGDEFMIHVTQGPGEAGFYIITNSSGGGTERELYLWGEWRNRGIVLSEQMSPQDPSDHGYALCRWEWLKGKPFNLTGMSTFKHQCGEEEGWNPGPSDYALALNLDWGAFYDAMEADCMNYVKVGKHPDGDDLSEIEDGLVGTQSNVITIEEEPDGGCPELYTFVEQDTVTGAYSFLGNNTILPHSEHYESPDVDLLKLDIINTDPDYYYINIVENASTTTYLDQVKLWVVDHDEGTRVATSTDDSIYVYSEMAAPISCKDNQDNDRLDEVLWQDSLSFVGSPNSYVVVDFVDPEWTNKGILAVIDGADMAKACKIYLDKVGGGGGWDSIGVTYARLNSSQWLINVSNVDSLRFRLMCGGSDTTRINRIALVKLESDWSKQEAAMDSAVHYAESGYGTYVQPLLVSYDELIDVLSSDEQISLRFAKVDSSTTYPLRDYVFQSVGYYSTAITPPSGIEEEPLEFGLRVEQLTPLSRIALINYSVPYATHVKIAIYDVAGRLTKSVIDEKVKPGRYSEDWKGKDDAGRILASGVYFVKMITDDYKKTVKVVILE